MWRWPKSSLRTWLKTLRPRSGVVLPRKPLRLTLYAQLQQVEEQDVELLKRVASAADQLERLRQYPEWSALLELKDESQVLATETARSLHSTDAQRARAVAEYWAIEGLFSTLYRTISNGRKARQTLQRVLKT